MNRLEREMSEQLRRDVPTPKPKRPRAEREEQHRTQML
jgi:hypothetical protein